MLSIGFTPYFGCWRLGIYDMFDTDSCGRDIVIGRALIVGPFMLMREYDGARVA